MIFDVTGRACSGTKVTCGGRGKAEGERESVFERGVFGDESPQRPPDIIIPISPLSAVCCEFHQTKEAKQQNDNEPNDSGRSHRDVFPSRLPSH